MRHSFLDKYSYLDSLVHRIPPLSKIVFSLIILLCILATPVVWWVYGIYFLSLFFLVLVSRVPLIFVLKRSMVVIPFVLLVSIFIPFFEKNGVEIVLITFTRAYLSMLTLILLASTTKFSSLLCGLSKMGMPKMFLVLLSYMYRYFFVIVDETERMVRAVRMRWFKKEGIYLVKDLAKVVGMLFIRSYEKSERVYYAMVMRGFTPHHLENEHRQFVVENSKEYLHRKGAGLTGDVKEL